MRLEALFSPKVSVQSTYQDSISRERGKKRNKSFYWKLILELEHTWIKVECVSLFSKVFIIVYRCFACTDCIICVPLTCLMPVKPEEGMRTSGTRIIDECKHVGVGSQTQSSTRTTHAVNC